MARGCSGREASSNSDHDWNWRAAKIAGSLKSSDKDFDGVETVWVPKVGKEVGNDICKNGACIRLGCGAPVKAAKAAAKTVSMEPPPETHPMPAFNGAEVMLAAAQVAAARVELASIDALVEHLDARRNVLRQIIGATGVSGGTSGSSSGTGAAAPPAPTPAPSQAPPPPPAPRGYGGGGASGGSASVGNVHGARGTHGGTAARSSGGSSATTCPGCACVIHDPGLTTARATEDEHGNLTWYCSNGCRDRPAAAVAAAAPVSAAAPAASARASRTQRGSGGQDSDAGLFGSSPEASPARPAAAATVPFNSALGKRKAIGRGRGRSGQAVGRGCGRSGQAHDVGDSSWMTGANDVSSAEENEQLGDGAHNTRILRR